jgi:hypothetical protein
VVHPQELMAGAWCKGPHFLRWFLASDSAVWMCGQLGSAQGAQSELGAVLLATS